jgi:hypothetical protein
MNKVNQITVSQQMLANVSGVSKVLKSGAVTVAPCSVKELREKFGLGNAEAKKLHRQHRARWASEQGVQLNAALEGGFNIAKLTRKDGDKADTITVKLVREKAHAKLTKSEELALLREEVARLSKLVNSAEIVPA